MKSVPAYIDLTEISKLVNLPFGFKYYDYDVQLAYLFIKLSENAPETSAIKTPTS